MKKIILIVLLAAILVFGGCLTQYMNKDQNTGGNGTADLCAGVNCPDKCDGTDFVSNGGCLEGSCIYDTMEKNSSKCMVNRFGLNLKTTQQECTYDRYFNSLRLFFTIKNEGDVAPKVGATIWLTGDGIDKKIYQYIGKEYGKNRTLWEEIRWPTYSYQGQQWAVRDINVFSEFDYKLIYCELDDVYSEACAPANGLVLFEGNTKNCEIVGIEKVD